MDELYMYDFKAHTWTFINPRGKKPAPRYLHTAVVVGDAMLVFGGTDKNAGDVWSFSFKKSAWTRLSHVSFWALTAGILDPALDISQVSSMRSSAYKQCLLSLLPADCHTACTWLCNVCQLHFHNCFCKPGEYSPY